VWDLPEASNAKNSIPREEKQSKITLQDTYLVTTAKSRLSSMGKFNYLVKLIKLADYFLEFIVIYILKNIFYTFYIVMSGATAIMSGHGGEERMGSQSRFAVDESQPSQEHAATMRQKTTSASCISFLSSPEPITFLKPGPPGSLPLLSAVAPLLVRRLRIVVGQSRTTTYRPLKKYMG
jgi:hypothetical protein